jgi:prephenate dehydrogenase
MGDISSVRIVGAGLIGTSIGLGLRSVGVRVEVVDNDPAAEALASDLLASDSVKDPDLVIFALPTSALSAVLNREYALNPRSSFIDIGSVKTNPLLEVSNSDLPVNRFLPTHPMAGREVAGPESARADLFLSRTWVYCPVGVDADVVEAALSVISALGATALALDTTEHDRAVAIASHLPQAVSSLLAKQLITAESSDLDLAGSGLRDTVRIAGSDPALWSEIFSANASNLLPLLINLQSDLSAFIQDLSAGREMAQWIEAGNAGKSRIPGKHGGKARDYTALPVVIEDKPGQLAALLNECAIASVNVEDLSIEHSPGQFTGLITLSLSQSGAQKLEGHLREQGWSVHSPR